MSPMDLECFVQVHDMPFLLPTLNYHVVDIKLDRTSNLIPEHSRDLLVGGPSIFQPKWHHHVLIISLECYERRLLLLLRV